MARKMGDGGGAKESLKKLKESYLDLRRVALATRIAAQAAQRQLDQFLLGPDQKKEWDAEPITLELAAVPDSPWPWMEKP